jgi:hypothetical protein
LPAVLLGSKIWPAPMRPIFIPGLQIAIEAAMGDAGGDALSS